MKNFSSTLLALLCLAPLSLHAGSTIALDAGQLTSSALTPMQIDINQGSPNGSLLLLVDLGAGNSASNVLTAGQYVSGNNTILAAGGFNNDFGTNETDTIFTFTSTAAQTGDELALRWFPQITLAQYQGGAKTTSLDVFGTYNPSGGNPDGGNTWTVPADGTLLYNLDFFTTNSDGGGSQPALAGFAATPVLPAIGAVPEPSTYAMLGLGGLALFFARRRFAKSV